MIIANLTEQVYASNEFGHGPESNRVTFNTKGKLIIMLISNKIIFKLVFI